MMQREHILLAELLHAEYAHTNSTNRMHSLCVVIFSLLLQCDLALPLLLRTFIFSQVDHPLETIQRNYLHTVQMHSPHGLQIVLTRIKLPSKVACHM